MSWFYYTDDRQSQGSVSKTVLKALAKNGRMTKETAVFFDEILGYNEVTKVAPVDDDKIPSQG